jgi:hypothetical protein
MAQAARDVARQVVVPDVGPRVTTTPVRPSAMTLVRPSATTLARPSATTLVRPSATTLGEVAGPEATLADVEAH